MPDPVAEILLSGTSRFTAQVCDGIVPPAFGEFVVADAPGGEVLAVVGEIRCGSFDSNRAPVVYGLTVEELFAQQPQLRELLVTEFDALVIGWRSDGGWRGGLPPRPPGLHTFVQPAPALAVRVVTRDGGWLRTLLTAEAGDDLLAAAISASLAVWQGDDARQQAVLLGRAAARLFGDDYDRLQALLMRISA